MSISQKIDSLRPHLDERGLDILDELSDLVLRFSPEHALRQTLIEIDSIDFDKDRLLELIDELELATAKYKQPERRFVSYFKVDLESYFDLLRSFVNMGLLGDARKTLDRYDKIFDWPKKQCGKLNYTCSGKDCEHKFEKGQVVCPLCGTTRRLCKSGVSNIGARCHVHTSYIVKSNVYNSNGRSRVYAQSLPAELEQSFIDVISDPNYLSVAPEIASLAARNAQLMSHLGDVDYIEVQTMVRQTISRMKKARSDDDMLGVWECTAEIERLLTDVRDDKRRWDEIASISGRLGRLADSERKRLIEEQKVITIAEMYALQDEMISRTKRAATVISLELSNRMLGHEEIRNIVLRNIDGSVNDTIDMDAKLNRLMLEAGREEAVIVEGKIEP
jgi:hypothetical protein